MIGLDRTTTGADTKDMSIHEKAADYKKRYPGMRNGQAYANAAKELDPEWADKMTGTRNDPFYVDENLPMYLEQWHANH